MSVTERPILFSAPMVRAIQDGRKTQTRRLMKPQPKVVPADYPRPGHWWPSNAHRSMLHVEGELQNGDGGWKGLAEDCCPYGKPGDLLWVRESGSIALDKSAFMYADHGGKLAPTARPGSDSDAREWKSCPSIHMPRWASRITLKVTDVRVERLQQISLQDVRAEGCEVREFWLFGSDTEGRRLIGAAVYRQLWEQINGPDSWALNPWVWAISFVRQLKEEP